MQIFLPFCDCIVVYTLCNFVNHRGAELVLYVRKHLRTIESLYRLVGFVKALIGADIVDKMDLYPNGESGLGGVVVCRDAHRRYFVSDDFSR